MTHPSICSTSEPWFLLPLLGSFQRDFHVSLYSSVNARKAYFDLVKQLDGGEDEFRKALANMIMRIYKGLSKNDEFFFLDKTPRYYLIIDEIVKMFPNAKLIFLFRNPVSIMSSIISFFGGNRLTSFHNYDIDLELGTKFLAEGWQKYGHKSIRVSYEDLTLGPGDELNKVFHYIGLETPREALTNFSNSVLTGQLGDKVGENVKEVRSSRILIKTNWIRKKYILHKLSKMNSQSLLVCGYVKDELILEVKAQESQFNFNMIRDIKDIISSWLKKKLKLQLFFSKSIHGNLRRHHLS